MVTIKKKFNFVNITYICFILLLQMLATVVVLYSLKLCGIVTFPDYSLSTFSKVCLSCSANQKSLHSRFVIVKLTGN